MQLGLKNNRRTKRIRHGDRKHKLHTKLEQSTGNTIVQKTKKEVHNKWKRKLQTARDLDTAAAVLIRKTSYSEAAGLQQDNS